MFPILLGCRMMKRQNSVADDVTGEVEEELERHREDARLGAMPSNAVHENLRRFRIARNLKKQDMAAMMEVTTRSYYDYEQGTRAIPSDALVRLAILTSGDLNEILLGGPVTPRPETINSAINDFCVVLKFLDKEYPEMDMQTRMSVARFVLTHDWQGLPRAHPGVIRDAVRLTTKYRYHPEDIPAPPFWEDYEDQDQFDQDMADWQARVETGLGDATAEDV